MAKIQPQPPAVVLSSGGLDSTTAMAVARSEGFSIYSLSFDYGQRHAVELTAAQRIARYFDAVDHLIVSIDMKRIGGSALTDDRIHVPKDTNLDSAASTIPVTYVPARNTLFLSYAVAWAETLKAGDIFIGVNAMDYSGYPDCRPEYIAAFETMANLATRAGVTGEAPVRIRTPLIQMRKSQIIQTGVALGVDYAMTISCYDPDSKGAACGHCDSCRLRRRGFQNANIPDPTLYR